jgi:hypothetical protein
MQVADAERMFEKHHEVAAAETVPQLLQVRDGRVWSKVAHVGA